LAPRRWRLLGNDGFEIDLPDSKANAAEFGYAGSGDNHSALFPKARVVTPAECGTAPSLRPRSTPTRPGRRRWRSACIPGSTPMSCSPPTAASTPGRRGLVAAVVAFSLVAAVVAFSLVAAVVAFSLVAAVVAFSLFTVQLYEDVLQLGLRRSPFASIAERPIY